MKRNIIDILIKEQIAKGQTITAKNINTGERPVAAFNPGKDEVLPGKYVGHRSYVYAWNEATKTYWKKEKNANADKWWDISSSYDYFTFAQKLYDGYQEYVKDLEDAQVKAAKKATDPSLSADEKKNEKEKIRWWRRAKNKIEQKTSEIQNKVSGKTIYKTDVHFYYKLENGVYSYQDAASAIDPNAWKVDDKVLTAEITSYINKLPERTETEIVSIFNKRFDAKKASGADIKPVPDLNDPSGLKGTNYIILDSIYYSEPFTAKPTGVKTTTALASMIYEPGKGLAAYNTLKDAVDKLPSKPYVNNKNPAVKTTSPGDDVVDNNKAVTVSKGKYDYKREGGKYYTKVKGAKKWIDIDSTKLPDAKKAEAKANIDKMITDAKPEEKENSVNAASNDLKTILTSIKNTVLIGEQFSNSALKVYTEWQTESKDKTGTELDEINNKYYSRIDGGYSSKFKPLLDKESKAVKALQSTANESMTQHIGYVLHNIETIQQQKKGWLNIYNEQPAPELDGKAELYKIQDGTTDIIAKGAYGAQINQ